MEPVVGYNLSAARLHRDDSPSEQGALAYTRGLHIHMARNGHGPESASGRKILTHELTHVVQQHEGRVRRPSSAKSSETSMVEHSGLEGEANRAALSGSPAGFGRETGRWFEFDIGIKFFIH
jgi:hypothetical protein